MACSDVLHFLLPGEKMAPGFDMWRRQVGEENVLLGNLGCWLLSWCQILQGTFRDLVVSVPWWVRAFLVAQGGINNFIILLLWLIDVYSGYGNCLPPCQSSLIRMKSLCHSYCQSDSSWCCCLLEEPSTRIQGTLGFLGTLVGKHCYRSIVIIVFFHPCLMDKPWDKNLTSYHSQTERRVSSEQLLLSTLWLTLLNHCELCGVSSELYFCGIRIFTTANLNATRSVRCLLMEFIWFVD